jgi:tripartite ATP-independent transporter DctP family solute receptor
MQYRKILMALFIGAVVTCMSGAAVAEQINIKLATNLPAGNIISTEAEYFAKIVDEKSNGRIKVTVYPLTLGNAREVIEGVQLGTIEMTLQAEMMNFAPEPGVFSLPFIFKGWDHLNKVLSSQPAQEIADRFLKKTGIRVLGWMEQGFRVTITNNKPIQTADDLKGLKIRLPEDKVLVRTFELLGANPTVIPWGEVYTSLQTGLVEGMESTPPGIYSMKFYEITNYLTLTNHQHSVLGVLINEGFYQKLSNEDKKIINEAADEMLKLNRQESRQNAELTLMKLVTLHKVTYNPDTTPFQEKTDPLYKEFGEQSKTMDIIEDIKKIK